MSFLDEIMMQSDCESTIFDDICNLVDMLKMHDADSDPEKKRNLMNQVSAYLGVNQFQTTFFCATFVLQFERNRSVSYETVAEMLGISTLVLLKHKKEVDNLIEKKLILKEERRQRYYDDDDDETAVNRLSFCISTSVANCIFDNKPLVILNDEIDDDDMEKFLSSVDGITNCDSPVRIRRMFLALENSWRNSKIIVKIQKKFTDDIMRFLYYTFVADRLYARNNNTPLLGILNSIVSQPKQRNNLATEFIEGATPIQKCNFIEIENNEFYDKATVNVTDDGLRFILGETANLYLHTSINSELLSPEKIVEKQLFYSDNMQKQLDTLYNIMDEEKFRALQQRLAKKGMSKGVACLLYGASGTGKTESVYQIAKKTGRAIHHVDISEAKTCWFGESQKRVKKIFTTYEKECAEARRNKMMMPILLLNEADAILSKRKDANSSRVAQEENAIQNVLLECIENFEGILIATTNIADNLDKAFERRFLFKLQFETPELDSRTRIWKNKLNYLKKAECESLAHEFIFSGGEIDNIARKIEIDSLLKGKKPALDEIQEMCRHEKLHSDSGERAIGFGV